MRTDISYKFDNKVFAIYENGKRYLNYNATRFLQKIRSDGGVAAAKFWLKPKKSNKPTKGFLKLVDHGRLDISLEALVLKEPWNTLFTDQKLEIARKRLTHFGFFDKRKSFSTRDESIPEAVENETHTEGAVEKVLVNHFERNKKARVKCIEYYKAICYVCEFDFSNNYGDQFEGLIHVHHLIPLSAINSEYEINPITDLRPVCHNCHAIIHRRNPCYTIEEVHSFLKKTRQHNKAFPADV